MFEKTKAIIPPHMSEDEFLSVLKTIVVRRRLNAPQKRGYTEEAFSRAFARVGHWTGGPGFIRIDSDDHNNDSGPICEAAHLLLDKNFKPEQWKEAAAAIGLTEGLATEIQNACELSKDRDPARYRHILIACSLPYSEEDNEDL